MNQNLYLDNNATAPIKPKAAEAVIRALEMTGNLSSVHRYGRMVRPIVEEARDRVAALLGADPANVVFTSGGTEANNMAVLGGGRQVIVSAVEHPSVMKAAPGAKVIPVDGDGVVDTEALDAMLLAAGEPVLVSVMLANNETGAVQPLAEVTSIAHRHGASVHCDAVQAAGKMAIDINSLGVDALSISAHKLGGPPGVGALVVTSGARFDSLLKGGGQERGRRAGTENVPGIAGFGAAAELAFDDLDEFAGLALLRDEMERRIGEACPPVVFFSQGAERLANTSSFALPGVEGDSCVMALDLAGIAVSAGSACSSGKVHASHVLKAMGVDDRLSASAIRVSMGWTTKKGDIERFIGAWSKIAASGSASPRVSGSLEPAA